MREALRSSLVSRDWRYAWSHGITDLDFDASWKFPIYEKGAHVHGDDVGWYVNWVNRVIESLRVEHINRFRVNFDLRKTWADDIDRWVAFAFEKRVKSFEFDFRSVGMYHFDHYPFPDISDPIERLRIFPSTVHVYTSMTNLQSLSLISVRVSSKALEFFLSNCPLLENLCIRRCRELIHLRINGSSLPLKHLQIYDSRLREGFEIDAPNLSSFECDYSLFQIKIKIGNIEKLTKLAIPSTSFLENFSQYAPQLVIVNRLCPRHVLGSFEGVELLRLKRAGLKVEGYDGGKNVLPVISSLLNGAPHLDTLNIDLAPIYHYFAAVEMERGMDDDDVPTCHQHASLKFVEITGSGIKEHDYPQNERSVHTASSEAGANTSLSYPIAFPLDSLCSKMFCLMYFI